LNKYSCVYLLIVQSIYINEAIVKIHGQKKKNIMERVNSSMIYLIHCKNLFKCFNIPGVWKGEGEGRGE
jgi:hypothetical protein